MPGKKVVGEKDSKKAKSDLASSRTKVLGNLQKKISEIEAAIMQLEKYMENDNTAIQEASEKGDGEAISTLSISLHESNQKLNALFKELEILLNMMQRQRSLMKRPWQYSNLGDVDTWRAFTTGTYSLACRGM